MIATHAGSGVALLAIAGLLAAGCDSGRPAAQEREPPPAIRRACGVAAGRARLPVECPTRWPQHGGPGIAQPRVLRTSSSGYLIDIANGFTRRPKPLVFHVIVAGQRAPFHGTLAGTAAEIGLPKHPRVLAHASVRGARATVCLAPPYPRGGIHGGHVIVTWTERGHGYVVSVHGVKLSHSALREVALRLARSAVPVASASGSTRAS